MLNPLLFVHSVIGYLATALLLVILSIVAWLLRPFSVDDYEHYHRWARIWGHAVSVVSRVRVEVEDPGSVARFLGHGPIVIACNHQSMLDIPILLGSLPGYFAFVSKIEVFGIPLLGKYMELFGCIRLKRGDKAGSREALSSAIDALSCGRSVLMFPEGTRTATGELLPFKRGAAVLAACTGVPIVPVALEGSFELLPKQSWIARPGTVTLRIGAPIPVPATAAEDPAALKAIMGRVQASVDGLLRARPIPVSLQPVPSQTKA